MGQSLSQIGESRQANFAIDTGKKIRYNKLLEVSAGKQDVQ